MMHKRVLGFAVLALSVLAACGATSTPQSADDAGGGTDAGQDAGGCALNSDFPVNPASAVTIERQPGLGTVAIIPGYSYDPTRPGQTQQLLSSVELTPVEPGSLEVTANYVVDSSSLEQSVGFSVGFSYSALVASGSFDVSAGNAYSLASNQVALVLSASVKRPIQQASHLRISGNVAEVPQQLIEQGRRQELLNGFGPFVVTGVQREKRLLVLVKLTTMDARVQSYFSVAASGGTLGVSAQTQISTEMQQARTQQRLDVKVLVDGAENQALGAALLQHFATLDPTPQSFLQGLQTFLADPTVDATWKETVTRGVALPIDQVLGLCPSFRSVDQSVVKRMFDAYRRGAAIRARTAAILSNPIEPALAATLQPVLSEMDGVAVSLGQIANYMSPASTVDEAAVRQQLATVEATIQQRQSLLTSPPLEYSVRQFDGSLTSTRANFPVLPLASKHLGLQVTGALIKSVSVVAGNAGDPSRPVLYQAYSVDKVAELSTTVIVPLHWHLIAAALSSPLSDFVTTLALKIEPISGPAWVQDFANIAVSRSSANTAHPEWNHISSHSSTFEFLVSNGVFAGTMDQDGVVYPEANFTDFVSSRQSNQGRFHVIGLSGVAADSVSIEVAGVPTPPSLVVPSRKVTVAGLGAATIVLWDELAAESVFSSVVGTQSGNVVGTLALKANGQSTSVVNIGVNTAGPTATLPAGPGQLPTPPFNATWLGDFFYW